MARPVLAPTTVRLTDARGAPFRFVTFGHGFSPVAVPVGYVPVAEPLAPMVGGRALAVVRRVPPVASRGRVVPVVAAPTGRTIAVAAPRLRSVIIRQDGLSVTVPSRSEPRQPLGSCLDSLTRDQRRNLKRRLWRTSLRKFKRAQAGRAPVTANTSV